MTPKEYHLENLPGTGENADYYYLLPFVTRFETQAIPSFQQHLIGHLLRGEPHWSVSSTADLTGGHWFDPWLCQHSFGRLMIVIATGFIPLSPLSVVSTKVMWESSQWLGKNIVWRTG